MGQVSLTIGGRRYDLACRDGDEAHLHALGDVVDARVAEAGRAVGGGNEARQLVMAALMLADELAETRAGQGGQTDPAVVRSLARLADRLETLAARLENKDAAA